MWKVRAKKIMIVVHNCNCCNIVHNSRIFQFPFRKVSEEQVYCSLRTRYGFLIYSMAKFLKVSPLSGPRPHWTSGKELRINLFNWLMAHCTLSKNCREILLVHVTLQRRNWSSAHHTKTSKGHTGCNGKFCPTIFCIGRVHSYSRKCSLTVSEDVHYREKRMWCTPGNNIINRFERKGCTWA